MAKKKKAANRGELLNLKDAEKSLIIETTIQLEELKLKDKRWTAKLKLRTTLPRSYHNYKIFLDLDEKPYLDRISDLEKSLDESLFKELKTSRRAVGKQIGDIRNELETMRKDCPHIEFMATVDQLVYKDGDTIMTCRIPDDIIEPLNKQKYRLEAYKIALDPIYS